VKRREALAAIEGGLEGGALVPIDPEGVPKEVRAEVVVMNRLIEHAADLGRQCRAAEAERDQALRLLRAVVEAVPAAVSLSAPDGAVIAASSAPLPAEHRRTIVPGTDGIVLAVGDVTDAHVSARLETGLAGLVDGLDRQAAGTFSPVPIDGLDDPLFDLKRAFNRATESVAEMIAIKPLFAQRDP